MKKVCFSQVITVFEVGNDEEHRCARDGSRDMRDRSRFQRKYRNFIYVLDNLIQMKIKKLPFDDLCNEIELFK